jgi:ABC-type multidrug transport system ATPase subunit
MKEGRTIEHPARLPDPVLQVDGLRFAYPQRALFAGLSARIPPGVTLVRGGDGVGKTTLLQLLAGVLPAQGGQLQVNGIALNDQPDAYRRQVFWADPRSQALDTLSPRAYFSALADQQTHFQAAILEDVTDGFALRPHLDKELYMLSAGSRRKVWMAAAFASGAPVTLIDAPFSALDKASIGFVMELLEDAAHHPTRAWVIAHFETPDQLPLASVIDLGD